MVIKTGKNKEACCFIASLLLFTKRCSIPLLILSGIISVTSCEEIITMDFPEHKGKLVVNSLFTENKVITVYLFKSTSGYDTLPDFIDSATVKLYKEGDFVENLTNIGSGEYRSNHLGEEGKLYEIEVSAEGFESVSAGDIIPRKTLIRDYTYKQHAGYHQWGGEYSTVDINFRDNRDIRNFYEIYAFLKSDTSYIEPVIWSYTIEDPVLTSSELDAYTDVFIFTDSLINGRNYTLKVPLEYSADLPTFDFHVSLSSVSENYYRYKRSLKRHLFNQGGFEYELFQIDMGNPVTLYSNINNGYGIFAAYNKSEIIFSAAD